jgi:hypothetical protein
MFGRKTLSSPVIKFFSLVIKLIRWTMMFFITTLLKGEGQIALWLEGGGTARQTGQPDQR